MYVYVVSGCEKVEIPDDVQWIKMSQRGTPRQFRSSGHVNDPPNLIRTGSRYLRNSGRVQSQRLTAKCPFDSFTNNNNNNIDLWTTTNYPYETPLPIPLSLTSYNLIYTVPSRILVLSPAFIRRLSNLLHPR